MTEYDKLQATITWIEAVQINLEIFNTMKFSLFCV